MKCGLVSLLGIEIQLKYRSTQMILININLNNYKFITFHLSSLLIGIYVIYITVFHFNVIVERNNPQRKSSVKKRKEICVNLFKKCGLVNQEIFQQQRISIYRIK